MRATIIRNHGGPEVLRTEPTEEPTAGPGQAVVRIAAAGLNFIDTYHRTGLYPRDLPFVPGMEAAGVVESVGPDVSTAAAGDRVAWCTAPGAYAEAAAVPAEALIPVPDEVSLGTAAAAALQGLTAQYLVRDTFPLGGGDSCLIHAGAGGVGLLLTQVAKRLGATVYATVGSEEKADLSRAAGADHVIVYTREDFAERVREIGGERCLDAAYDGVGRSTLAAGLDLLRPRGVMAAFGNASGPPDPVDPLILGKASLFLTRPSLFHYARTREELLSRAGELFDWITDGLQVRIGARYPLEQAADAHRALEGRSTTGKVLIIP